MNSVSFFSKIWSKSFYKILKPSHLKISFPDTTYLRKYCTSNGLVKINKTYIVIFCYNKICVWLALCILYNLGLAEPLGWSADFYQALLTKGSRNKIYCISLQLDLLYILKHNLTVCCSVNLKLTVFIWFKADKSRWLNYLNFPMKTIVQSNLVIRNGLIRNRLVLKNHFLWTICQFTS